MTSQMLPNYRYVSTFFILSDIHPAMLFFIILSVILVYYTIMENRRLFSDINKNFIFSVVFYKHCE